MQKNTKKYVSILPIMFLPLYITTSGIFIAEVSVTGLHLGKTGFVLPLVFFIGILLFFNILVKTLKTHRINKDILENPIIKIFIIFVVYFILLVAIGSLFSGNYRGLIKLVQFLTGGVGIVISVYLFSIKRISPPQFFGYLTLFFVVIIFIQSVTSIVMFGVNPLSGAMYPSILGAGIYQSRVYFPYLVTLIFFCGLPYLIKRFGSWTIILFLVFLFYIFTLQVRGAMVSFVVMSVFYLIFVSNIKFKYLALFPALAMPFLFEFISSNKEVLGRIGEVEKVQDLNGRTDLWINILKEMGTSNFLFGSYLNDIDNISAHNQYFEFLTLSGFFPLMILTVLVVFSLKMFKDSFKYNNHTLRIFSLIMITTLLVDLNVNVPLTNTNPAIHYWFFWSGIYFYYMEVVKGKGKIHNV
ncbi:O-antigen ligase family protein [Planococcus dechangensis]|uniref:O-antigen ligase family protein n=1 Tax=Planococcus dechangensis TaxID=1176255 RepID=A0ABV9MC80_9BACL